MESGVVCRAALVEVRRIMKVKGFSSKGGTFYREVAGGNTIALSTQKSVKSSSTETELTINFGVYSARVGSKLFDDSSSVFDVSKAHWRKRLTEGGREKWLHISETDSVAQTVQLILEAIEGVLPDLVDHSTDDALRDQWFAGSSPGIGDMQRLLFLAIVVNEIGPRERLGSVVGELRSLVGGSVHEGLVERRLAGAGVSL